MGNHVFICYSRKDEDFVIKLATNLKRQGVPVWLDQWDISSGANWSRTIERALNECARLLIILSPASVDSDEVQSEWLAALDEKKVIVPILYKTCHVPFRLKPIQYIDFTSRSADDIAALDSVLVALGIAENTLSRSAEILAPDMKISAAPSHASNLDESDTWINEGDALYGQYKLESAINAYNKAIEIQPQNAKAWSNKGLALHEQGKYNEAFKAYDRAIENNPQYAEAWYNRGMAFQEQAKKDKAIKDFERAIEINPQYAEAWRGKGLSLFLMSKYDEAIKACDMAIEINPQYAKAWWDRGFLLKILKRNTEASAALAKAKELGFLGYSDEGTDSEAYAWKRKGSTFWGEGRLDKAIEAFDKAIEINPQYAEAWKTKGHVLRHQGKQEEAIKAYERAIETKGQYAERYAEAWGAKGLSLYLMRKYDDAIKAYDMAIEIRPQMADFWKEKGNVLKALGRTTEADAAFAKAKELGYAG
jgi:tetratricopeptide (TPR) repeat protein